MCIGFPGIIISIDKDNYAIIDISGTRREVCLDIVDEPVAVGDYDYPRRLRHSQNRCRVG
jgi:hydrogenase expression/formation protein HypC